MATPKKYFHDRTILILLSVNAFLALANSLYILLSINFSSGATYVTRFRPRLGIDRYSQGSATGILSFAIFTLLVFGFHAYLSKKAYPIKRHFAIVILAFATLLLVLSTIISHELLGIS